MADCGEKVVWSCMHGGSDAALEKAVLDGGKSVGLTFSSGVQALVSAAHKRNVANRWARQLLGQGAREKGRWWPGMNP